MTDAAFDLGDSAPAEQSAPRGWLRFIRASGGAAVVIRILLGLVLLAAAVLKGHLLATDPFAPTGVPGPRWLAVVFVELEFFLAVWLLSGFFAPAARRVAIVAFIGFAGVSVYRAVAGEASCGCFGRSEVSPWITLAFDAVAVGALVLHAPSQMRRSKSATHLWRAVVISLLALVVGSWGANKMSQPAWASSSVPGLVCAESSYDFGSLRTTQAGNLSHTFIVRNTSNQPIRIVRTQTTCGCTGCSAPTEPIAPNGTASVRVVADWATRPGNRLEEVYLFTDAEHSGQLALSLRGQIQSVASILPGIINFGIVQAGHTVTRDIYLRSDDPSSKLSVLSVRPDENISVVRANSDGSADPSLPILGGAGHFCVRLTTHLGDQPGAVVRRVIFFTNIVDQPKLILRLSARIVPTVTACPRSLLFRVNDRTKEVKLTTNVIARPSYLINGEGFSVAGATMAPGGNIVVTVCRNGEEVKGATRAELVVSLQGRCVQSIPLMAVGF